MKSKYALTITTKQLMVRDVAYVGLFLSFLFLIFYEEFMLKYSDFEVPKVAEIIRLYKQNHSGNSITECERQKLYFFMIDIMSVVEKGWNKTGSYSKVVTPSDEAFGLFLLEYYSDSIPAIDVLKRDAPREKRKKRLDGEQLQQAIAQYGNWQHTFREIRNSKSTWPTQNPMMEIDGEIMQFISDGRNKQNGIEKRKKKKKTNLSDLKQHHRSVEDFCDLDSVPGDLQTDV